MKKIILQFGLLAIALLVLLQLSKYSLQYQFLQQEIWIPLFGVLFLAVGVGLSRFLRSKPTLVEKEDTTLATTSSIHTQKIEALGISKREYEVLEKIAEGHSNQEIAELLFISESTVKTHVSKLLSKLDAKRRTQAVKNAKTLQIL